MERKDRTVYFDYLRVSATFAVILLHMAAQNWHTTDVSGFEWKVFNFYDSIVRWAVPVFVMISGALFLNRDIPLKKIYSKYIVRMVTAFVTWSVIYVLFFGEGNKTDKVLNLLRGSYHMWFIFMIVGIYMCIPFIKPIIENDNRIKYYLCLAVVFAFVIPELKLLVNDFGSERIMKAMDVICKDVNNMGMNLVLGYVGYFILGYYMNKIDMTKRTRIIIYILGLLGFAFTIEMDLIVALRTQQSCDHYYNNFTVNVLFEAMAVFTWFKYKKYENETLNAFIQKLSKYSFGAYLVHVLVLKQLKLQMGLNTLSFNPVFSVISISILVAIISFGVSAVFNHIPIVKKYMV